MGIIMKKLHLFAGIAVSISGLFAGYDAFAASGCITSACDPAAAAAACDPAVGAVAPACTPVASPADPSCAPAAAAAAACDPGCATAACGSTDPLAACNAGCNASPASCSPNCDSGCLSAAACGEGVGANAPCTACGGIGGACNACGGTGFCGAAKHHGCGILGLGLLGCNGCGSNACGNQCNLNDPNIGCLSPKLRKSLFEGTCWSGYMNAGYDTNFAGDRSNGYVDCWNNTTPAFNALYIAARKKAVTNGCGFDIGYGLDFMFGEDARLFRSARGLDNSWVTGHMYNPDSEAYDRDSYGFAMPQLYFELAINNWSVKAGHFYGLLGYEGATADSRFFYTKGLVFQACPISQTGFLVSYNGFQNLDFTLGWVNGWGNGFDNSEYNDGLVEGAFTYHMNKFASLKYAFMAGTADLTGAFGFLGPYNDLADTAGSGSVHNLVLDLQLTARLESVSLALYGEFNGSSFWALGQHFYYDLNACAKVGVRAEWLKASINGADSVMATIEMATIGIGLNLHPHGIQNLYVRPELRYDRATGDKASDLLNGRADQFTIGFDVMLTF